MLDARRGMLTEDWRAVEDRLEPLLDSLAMAWGSLDDPADIYMTRPYSRLMAATKGHVEAFAARAEEEAGEIAQVAAERGERLAMGFLSLYGINFLAAASRLPRKPLKDAPRIALTALVDAIEDGPDGFVARSLEGMRGALSYAQVRTHDQIVQSLQTGMAAVYNQTQGMVYQRFSVLGKRTCIACILLHGRVYRSPSEFYDHPNGFCFIIPVPEGEELPISPAEGLDWFRGLTPDEQREILGEEYYAAWIEGRYELIELVKWIAAGYAVVTPLQELFDDDTER